MFPEKCVQIVSGSLKKNGRQIEKETVKRKSLKILASEIILQNNKDKTKILRNGHCNN